VESLAEGKEAVLAFLEADAQRETGQTGEYRLLRDDSGNVIVFAVGQ
jgi:hypothetical protein